MRIITDEDINWFSTVHLQRKVAALCRNKLIIEAIKGDLKDTLNTVGDHWKK